MFNAIEYSQTNYQCMYIFFSPGKKESSFGKRKKELSFEKLRITSFIEFEKRSACRKKRKITIIFNSSREKKKKKERKSEDRSKEGSFLCPTNHFFLRLCDKGKREKETKGERLVNDGHNCGLLSQ